MIRDFIKNKLKIYNYKIIQLNWWKDNLTYEIKLTSWESFIIQHLFIIKTKKNQEFINKIIFYINNNSTNIHFAWNYNDTRFIEYKWCLFQLMKKINWNIIKEKDINIQIIEKMAKYIAEFHNDISSFNWLEYKEINYFKKMHNYRLKTKELIINNWNDEVKDIFIKMNLIAKNLKENPKLPIWIIHWDPSFKNFLIDIDNNITGIVDYDMMSVNTILWDLADLIRSHMKIKSFTKKEFEILINSYNDIRKLSKKEKRELKNYCTMMILDTWFRYLLNTLWFDEHKNFLWDKNDSINKAKRCLYEISKLNTFYI